MSVYISNLPEYTGNTYNGYIVWNDSGETTTYKTRYNGIFGEKIEIKNTSQSSNTINAINRNTLIVGYGNNISASVSGKNYFILGHNNTINSNVGGNPTNIIIGNDSTASAFGAWVVGSYSSASGERSLKWGNNGSASGLESFAWGEQSNASGERSFVFGAYQSGSGNNSFTFGNNNTNSGTHTFNFGTLNETTSSYSVAIGGYDNDITGAGGAQGIFVGEGCDITSSGLYNSIINGNLHTISGDASRSALIGGSSSSITGGTNVIGVGLTGRTGLSQNNTTYTENTHTFRTYSTQVQSVSSGTTFTCNLNNGGKAQFYLTGASTIDITNVRDGQSFLIKTQTDGGHTITWTSTGYTFKWKGGSSNPGNNKIDLFRFEVFGSVIYGELISDFS